MKLIAILLFALALTTLNASVLQTLKSTTRSLERRLVDLKSELDSGIAARKEDLEVPFALYKKNKGVYEAVKKDVSAKGEKDRKKFEAQLKELEGQAEMINAMRKLNEKLAKYQDSYKKIVAALTQMYNGLKLQISGAKSDFKKRETKRRERVNKAKDNKNDAKKEYDDMKKTHDKINKKETDDYNKEKKEINKDLKDVKLARKALRESEKPLVKKNVRYVRISTKGYLSLAEVQVFNAAGINVALHQKTKQSSQGWGGAPSRAVDGNTNGNYWKHSVTHTQKNGWWEVDLGKLRSVSKVVVWNRSDCCASRLNQGKVTLMDDKRNVVKSFTSSSKRKQTFKVGPKCTC